jgi:hypothetical protein
MWQDLLDVRGEPSPPDTGQGSVIVMNNSQTVILRALARRIS